MSVSAEDVAGIDLGGDVVERRIVAVGDDGAGLRLERRKVVHYAAAEERTPVFERRLVDDDLRTFCLDAFHYPLYRRLPKVVRIRLHRQAVNADGAGLLVRCIVLPILL